jgi:sensor histidine kinase YesM
MKKAGVILLQVGYWAVYLVLILLFDIVISLTAHRQIVGRRFLWVLWHNPAWIYLLVPAILTFYLSYGLLFRWLLVRRRIWWLAMVLAASSVLSAALVMGLAAVTTGVNFGWSIDTGVMLLFLTVIGMINGILGLVIKGFISWVAEMRLKEELNRRNFEMELALVRSQLSPHFLFNTLNNIDVLITKDAVRASDYLNKLSEILRFMLYETKTSVIPIGRELGHIEKYIELQRIRIANPAAVKYTVEGEAGRLMVEPMLFLPFIENAFKHAEKREDDSIRIRFVLTAGRIEFNCENRIGDVMMRSDSESGGVYGGLGHELIRKRLDLLYPGGKHLLEIRTDDDRYRAKLILDAN